MDLRCTDCNNLVVLIDFTVPDLTTLQLLLFCPVCEEHLKATIDMKVFCPAKEQPFPGNYL